MSLLDITFMLFVNNFWSNGQTLGFTKKIKKK